MVQTQQETHQKFHQEHQKKIQSKITHTFISSPYKLPHKREENIRHIGNFCVKYEKQECPICSMSVECINEGEQNSFGLSHDDMQQHKTITIP